MVFAAEHRVNLDGNKSSLHPKVIVVAIKTTLVLSAITPVVALTQAEASEWQFLNRYLGNLVCSRHNFHVALRPLNFTWS